jgi:ATP synthase protein I
MHRLDRATMASWLFFAGSVCSGNSRNQQPWRTKEAEVLRGLDDRRVVPLTLLAQAGLCACLAALLGIWWGGTAALSTLLGGLAAVGPNAFLAARMFAPHADDAKAVMRSAWLGEIGKLLLTALLFGLIFALVRPLSAPAVFAGFVAAQTVVFGALLFGGGAASTELTTKS